MKLYERWLLMILMRFLISCFFLFSPQFIHTFEKITVLTYPVGRYSSDSWCHAGVTHSLLRGLKELQVDFNYNPSQEDEVGSTVVVLTNIDALQQAIDWKKQRKIKKLLVGPNLATIFLPDYKILLSPEIDINIVPSHWIKTAYLEVAPELINCISIWPAGVDINYWNPSKKLHEKSSNQVLVYWKTDSEDLCKSIELLLQKYHWNPVRIQYGQYDQASYKNILQSSFFAVFISRSESQSLALAEAWAMDVPTLIWDPQELIAFNRKFSEVSACPYLHNQNGRNWKTLESFECLLKTIMFQQFAPRTWVLENMSDPVSAKMLISIIDSIIPVRTCNENI